MNKRIIVSAVSTGVLLLGLIFSSQSQPSSPNAVQSVSTSSATEKVTPICDGTAITADCTIDNVKYSTYKYYPALAEKTHTESVTTYHEEITSYCTLCRDGTYSPTCATGRGACSHHGKVAQWSAPRYSSVPEYSTKTVVDALAQESYYEKVAE